MEKKSVERGETDLAYYGDIELVAWRDNRAVYMASNNFSGLPEGTSTRWCRKEKKGFKFQLLFQVTIKVWEE